MTETSRPYPGTTLGDAGPYSASDWWDCWLAQARAGGRLSRVADYDIGIFYAIANALEPTSNVTEIDVDTGASLIDGLYHENTASVAVPIPATAAAGDSRIDVIVVRKNYQQAVTYTPTGGAPTVGPREARITVIRGAEAVGPVAPALTQDTTRTTYWDIPIAQVQVDDAGALSDFTDLREFVDAETKYIHVNPSRSINMTDATEPLEYHQYGTILPDSKVSQINADWYIPADFISDLYVAPIIRTDTSGNYYGESFWGYAQDGAVYFGTQGGSGATAVSITQNDNNVILSDEITGVAAGDILMLECDRDATDPLDTVNDDVYFAGFLLTYFGWKK